MVAILVGLRWRQLGHQLSRNPWFIVALVFSGLVAAGMLTALAFGLGALRVLSPDLVGPILIIVGSVITAGWWVGSIVVSADDSLAPDRFALLPVTARRLLPGLVLAGVTTIGGIGTALALLLTWVGWSVSPAALVTAIVLAPLALLTCVLGARVVSGLLAGWLARRRTRDFVLTVGVLLLASSGLLFNLLASLVGRLGSPGESFRLVAEVLGWTPLGAVYGVSSAAAAGEWAVSAGRLLVAVATVIALWAVAERSLAARLVDPIVSSGGGRVRSGGVIDRLLPATPTGAIAARTLRYRRRDPRHLVNVVMLLVFPLLMVAVVAMNSLSSGGWSVGPALILLPAINAFLLATIVQMDIAYDNNAIALHITSGVRGVADRAGRLLGMAILAVPLLAILCVLACLVTGAWELLPASFGATFGLSLVVAGAASFVGALLPGRAPPPGANPLGRGSAGGAQSFLALIIVTPIALVIGGPALGFAIASLWTPWLAWVSLGCALLLGGAAVWGGIVLGGRMLDRRWPRVLAEVSSEG